MATGSVILAVVWGEVATYISCPPARGPNVAIPFPLLGQGGLVPYGAAVSVIGEPVATAYVVRWLGLLIGYLNPLRGQSVPTSH